MAHIPDDFEAQQYDNGWSTFDQMEEMGMGLGSNPPSFPDGTNVPNNPLVGGSSGQQQSSESSVIPHGKRAKWWRWFSIEEQNINGKITTKAVCKFCKATLLNDSSCGVSHIKRHGEKCAKDHAPKDPHQTTLMQNEDGQISTFRYNQKAMRTGLAQYIASAELPFTVAECKYFAKFITKYVQPQRFSIYNTWNNIRVESWKMKELRWMYSWKKLFVIEPNLALDEGFVHVKPLLAMRNDEILIEKREGQLILHDPRSEIETYFKIRGDPRLFHETGFVGSLVSPFHNQG
ncbi:hypothetical protein LWI29_015126 [Acer saccharum]|uniref:BED-type domain-containing protein n=1 Tax=Acer saccharum TaxID=4024 RepID=A0AA39VRT9_ACESA|nr:hypothetical protein LWI29_015126 [Acer saccharum]